MARPKGELPPADWIDRKPCIFVDEHGAVHLVQTSGRTVFHMAMEPALFLALGADGAAAIRAHARRRSDGGGGEG